jgi:hypothetical protein
MSSTEAPELQRGDVHVQESDHHAAVLVGHDDTAHVLGDPEGEGDGQRRLYDCAICGWEGEPRPYDETTEPDDMLGLGRAGEAEVAEHADSTGSHTLTVSVTLPPGEYAQHFGSDPAQFLATVERGLLDRMATEDRLDQVAPSSRAAASPDKTAAAGGGTHRDRRRPRNFAGVTPWAAVVTMGRARPRWTGCRDSRPWPA